MMIKSERSWIKGQRQRLGGKSDPYTSDLRLQAIIGNKNNTNHNGGQGVSNKVTSQSWARAAPVEC